MSSFILLPSRLYLYRKSYITLVRGCWEDLRAWTLSTEERLVLWLEVHQVPWLLDPQPGPLCWSHTPDGSLHHLWPPNTSSSALKTFASHRGRQEYWGPFHVLSTLRTKKTKRPWLIRTLSVHPKQPVLAAAAVWTWESQQHGLLTEFQTGSKRQIPSASVLPTTYLEFCLLFATSSSHPLTLSQGTEEWDGGYKIISSGELMVCSTSYWKPTISQTHF